MTDAQEAIFRRSLEKIAREQNYANYEITVTPISSDGANYTSKLFLATITGLNKPKLNLFAKVAAVGEAFRSQMMGDIFEVEHYTYSTLSKIFDRIQDKYQVLEQDRLVMPKFYKYDNTFLEETLVLEDLVAEGFTTHDRKEGCGYEYSSRCIEELAKLHALSIVFQEEYPEEFEEAAKVYQAKNLAEDEMMSGAIDRMMKNSLAAVTDKELQGRLQAFVDKNTGTEFMKQYFGSDRRPVLAHGDFRMSNIMHKPKQASRSREKMEVTILDYQTMHVGVGVRDVLYFLMAGTDEEFRGKHFHQLLDYYYDQICVSLRRFNHDPRVLFPRADYEYEVQKNMPGGMMVAMFVLPVVTIESENAPTVDHNFGIESMTNLRTSSLFSDRLNGVVRDCAKWGII